ncbi:MFS transporter, partial [Acinetobacter sp. 11520]|nr:MFS transporter [Acinetobacter sp. 11520]
MAIGAVCSGALADRFGRKTIFAITMAIYSIATALCAFAPDLKWLLIFRFIVGLGLGGQLPVAVTLVSEYIPAHVRGRFIVLLESFWGLGWLVAALISYFIIP